MFEDNERLISSSFQTEDIETDYSLRPRTLEEYIGQDKVKSQLDIFIQAARLRGEALDHVLLYGPPGLGKTTLSYKMMSFLLFYHTKEKTPHSRH